MKKLDWISEAKGFAILGVVAVHTAQRFSLPSKLASVAYAGAECVQLFFIISAYLTFRSLDAHPIHTGGGGYARYLIRKITRLMPVLYLTALWHLVESIILTGGIPDIHDAIWRNGFFCVTFLNGFSYHYINPWLNWYVGDLAIFLAIAPALYTLIRSPKRSILFFLITTVTGWLSTIILNKQGADTGWYFYFWFPRQLPLLSLGIVLHQFEKHRDDTTISYSVRTFLFLIAFCFLCSLFFFTTPMEHHVRFGFLLIVFAYTLFGTFPKAFAWLRPLGDYSYGIYLFHGCLLSVFDRVYRHFSLSRSSVAGFFCYYLLLVFVSLLLAKVVHVLVEKPFAAFVRKRTAD